MSAPSNTNSSEAPDPMLRSSPLRHLMALGQSLGARSQVLCATTDQRSTLTRISFTFDDDMPFCSCDPLESIRTDDTILANSTAILPAATANPCTSPPPSPALSAISTTIVDDNESVSSALDSAFNSLDITGMLGPPPAREVNYDHSWYAVTIGKKVGVFCGWSNVAPHVIGVPGAYYKPAADQHVAQAIYNSAFAARKVSVVL
ncbi:hypothetical protein PILCRDRAFT_601 [Piloderma croceum F 1598]|uniref:Ribonuclease H1 N-terminal domain-containing protein n=1 Tax=Piloderma croceum (strain F 1598) TaxID=765440 RepID=A0A0C3G564_PILCF|nr:hypothetical protein PILCRDRAFT_601 [Piloderma croceum F 1598]